MLADEVVALPPQQLLLRELQEVLTRVAVHEKVARSGVDRMPKGVLSRMRSRRAL